MDINTIYKNETMTFYIINDDKVYRNDGTYITKGGRAGLTGLA
jgi:hypothetical protein